MRQGLHHRKIMTIAATTVIAAAIVLYYLTDPSSSEFFPKCPFYLMTGLKCPGCGSQRALHELLCLHIGQAFRYNALMTVAIPFLTFTGLAWALRKRTPGLYSWINSRPVILTVLAVIILWWILRNLTGL